MSCNFYLLKNHKIANNSTNAKSRVKIIKDSESLEFFKLFGGCSTKFKNNQILLNKMNHRFLVTNQAIYCVKDSDSSTASSLLYYYYYIIL
jgi:hypothetical protein